MYPSRVSWALAGSPKNSEILIEIPRGCQSFVESLRSFYIILGFPAAFYRFMDCLETSYSFLDELGDY
jgi:hypothetical protein